VKPDNYFQIHASSITHHASSFYLREKPMKYTQNISVRRRISRLILILTLLSAGMGGAAAFTVCAFYTFKNGFAVGAFIGLALFSCFTGLKLRNAVSALTAESEKKYHRIAENAAEGIFQFSPDGRLRVANRAFAEMFGYDSPQDMILQASIFEALYADPAERDEFRGQIKASGTVKNFEAKFSCKNGTVADVCVNAYPVWDQAQNLLYYEGTVQDIGHTRELEILRKTAESLSQSKSEFLTNISHEIRTPINAVIGFTELSLKSAVPVKLKDYLVKIQASGRLLLGIIDDILDFSRIEAGTLELENKAFQLDELLNNLSDMFCYQAAEKGVELIISVAEDVPSLLVGDPKRLGQIIINLTNNAFKFTEKGEVVVKVALAEAVEGKARIRFSVRDTGIGIASEKMASLFDSFTQGDTSITRKFGGTGLGLAICKRLTEMMNGEIWARSQPGKGTVFYFTVTLTIQSERKKYLPVISDDLRGMRILVVDDNELIQEYMQRMLEKVGFQPDAAFSGEEALEKLHQQELLYDLVLMDWMLPEMDGIEVTKCIRANAKTEQIPVIMVTAFGRDEVMQRAENAGIDAFIIKPVKISLLAETISEIVRQKRPETCSENLPPIEPDTKLKIKGARVLLVEDNIINQELALEMLGRAGIRADVAKNGKEAVKSVVNTQYDAVLMDLQMPEMDGYEATRLIRSVPRYKNLPIIAMTAHVMKKDREKCIAAGMNDFMSKPVESNELFSLLEKWIAGDKSQGAGDSQHPASSARRPAPGTRRPAPGIQHPASPQPPTQVSLPALPGIDTQSALNRLKGNSDLFIKLLKMFCKNYENSADKIRKLLDSGDRDGAKQLAHTVKGVAANLSADRLYQTAYELEKELSPESSGEWENLLPDFEHDLKQVSESANILEREFKERHPSSDRDMPVDSSKAGPLMSKLSRLLKGGNLEAETCMMTLRNYLDSCRFQKQIEAIEEHIMNFDFDGAQIPLSEIAQAMEVSLDE
jgi:PAS domain S-box-containing protein